MLVSAALLPEGCANARATQHGCQASKLRRGTKAGSAQITRDFRPCIAGFLSCLTCTARRQQACRKSTGRASHIGCRVQSEKCGLDESLFGEGLVWQDELDSNWLDQGRLGVDDLKDSQALAMEIRSNVLRAALVKLAGDGTFEAFEKDGLVSVDLCLQEEGSNNDNAQLLQLAVKKTMAQFKWKGVLGCSVTKRVARSVGVDDTNFLAMSAGMQQILNAALPGNVYACAIPQTLAAGYAELVSLSKELGPEHSLGYSLVVTLSADNMIDLGAAVYHGSCRVKNAGLNKHIISDSWRTDFRRLHDSDPASWTASDGSGGLAAPEPGTAAFGAFAALLDGYLVRLLQAAGSPNRLILLRTGNLAQSIGYLPKLLPSLSGLQAAAADASCEVVVRPPQGQSQAEAEPTVLRGAAFGALSQMREQLALKQVAAALQTAEKDQPCLQTLSAAQLRAAFDAWDLDGDGRLEPDELLDGLSMMGVTRELDHVLQEMDRSEDKAVGFDEFLNWWRKEVIGSPVTIVTGVDEFDRIMQKESWSKPLVVIEVVMTYCRSCKRFSRTYVTLAGKFAEARFLQVVANSNSGMMDMVRNKLGVKKTPSFLVFSAQDTSNPLAEWSGVSAAQFEKQLQACLNQD